MMKRRKRKYILVAGDKNVFAGLWHWGVMIWSRAVIREASEAVRMGKVILAYGRVGGDGMGES